MAVTSIIRIDYEYDGTKEQWNDPHVKTTSERIQKINDYNVDHGRFLYYPWGVFVTAYARRNLFTGICEFSNDYIYSDTDSIKVRNVQEHADYIKRYNEQVSVLLNRALDYHGLPRDLASPKNMNGKLKPLGVWDLDGEYSSFKSLGAKRYLVRYKDTGEISLTVSGINKKIAVPYLIDKYGENGVFDAFSESLYIPKGYTGKMIHTYIDDETEGDITDYRGHTAHYHERSSVHLEDCDYSLSITREYMDYITGLRDLL